MKLIENMTIHELDAEIASHTARKIKAQAALDKIHDQRDYSDEVAKHFHLGMVGFRRDTKRQEQTLNKAINNGVEACKHYDTIADAEARIQTIERARSAIDAHGTDSGDTYAAIMARQRKAQLDSAPTLDWAKVLGQFGGMAYQHGDFQVERVDAGFVVIRHNGEFIRHCKTVKEAKQVVSAMCSKRRLAAAAAEKEEPT